MVKSLRVVGVRTINGEKHYIVHNLESNENPTNSDFDEAKIKKIMKKEASEPLLLLRSE